jgi:DNA-directed RNA polymerase subunit M
MQFCKKCGNRLKNTHMKVGDRSMVALACSRCGYYEPVSRTVLKPEVEEERATIKVVGDLDKSLQAMPKATVDCPKCGNREAYWWLLQTRSSDEPTTQFYRCTKCDHTWRLYS